MAEGMQGSQMGEIWERVEIEVERVLRGFGVGWLNSGDMRWMGIGSQHVIHLHANANDKCVGKIPSLYLYLFISICLSSIRSISNRLIGIRVISSYRSK